jgi:hypothetical protein
LVNETCKEVLIFGAFPKLSAFSLAVIGHTNNYGLLAQLDPTIKKHKISYDDHLIEKVKPKVFIFGGLNEFG